MPERRWIMELAKKEYINEADVEQLTKELKTPMNAMLLKYHNEDGDDLIVIKEVLKVNMWASNAYKCKISVLLNIENYGDFSVDADFGGYPNLNDIVEALAEDLVGHF